MQSSRYSDYATGWKIRGSNFGRCKRFFSSSKRPDRLCTSHSLLLYWYRGSFQEAKRLECEVIHSLHEVKKAWSCTSNLPFTFVSVTAPKIFSKHKISVLKFCINTLRQPLKQMWELEIWLHSFLTLVLDGVEWSASRSGLFTRDKIAPEAR